MMRLHGWLMEVNPGAELAPGVSDMTWHLYETKREGIECVEGQISNEWEYERIDFVWGEDLQDYCGLHGLVAYARLNKKAIGSVRMGKNVLHCDFILCGQLHGVAMPFHTEAMAYEIIQWFLTKQEQWYAIYSKPTEREAAEKAKAEEAGSGAGSSQRRARPRLH